MRKPKVRKPKVRKLKIRNKITLIYAYYENEGMLRRHLTEWDSYPAKFKPYFKAIIVDDGSPHTPAEKYIRKCPVGFPIKLYRIKEDIPWNQNGARNLAMTFAKHWCLMTDIDHMLSAIQVPKLLNLKIKPDKFYVPLRQRAADGMPYKRHPNSYLLTQHLYWKAGGYDESYAGYYGTDSTFRKRLINVGERIELNDITLTLFGREVIADASTVAYGRKGTKYHVSQNPVLALRKKICPEPIDPLNFKWERVI